MEEIRSIYLSWPYAGTALDDWVGEPWLVEVVVDNAAYHHHPPPSENARIIQGQTFTVRHTSSWTEPEYLGYYSLALYRDCYEDNPYENFTFLYARAYFIAGAHAGEPIENSVIFVAESMGAHTRYTVAVSADLGDDRDGQFSVDVTMRASGFGDVPHSPSDNHPVSYAGPLSVRESAIVEVEVSPIAIEVLPRQLGVAVNISPTYQGGVPGATLTYAVTVANVGNVQDAYFLTAADNSGWGPMLSENLLENVSPGENRAVALSVAIPDGEVCTLDNIAVVATSMADNSVRGSDESVAHLGKARIKLWLHVCCWGVNVDLNLLLREDSRNLVLKFYTWGTYEGENILWSGTTPSQVVMTKYVPHPIQGYMPERVRLVLADEDTNEVQTITTYVVRRVDLWPIILYIKSRWPFAGSEERNCYWQKIIKIKGTWPFADP